MANCKNCSKEIEVKKYAGDKAMFCNKDCRFEYTQNKKSDELKVSGVEGIDYIICKWCNKAVGRVYGNHSKYWHNEKTKEDYQKDFPGAPISTELDLAATSANSGLFMRKPEYRQKYSEMMKGENNPMHSSKTTDLFRKSNSPFSIDFYRTRNPDKTELEIHAMWDSYYEMYTKDRLLEPQLQYWINKGFTIDEAIVLRSDRQKTFSLEKCIQKYGEIDGLQRWKDRQIKWISNNKKSNFSKVSQKLFIELYNARPDLRDKMFFATLNVDKEIDMSGTNFETKIVLEKIIIRPDFIVNKSIIEFDGTYYHRKNSENIERELKRDAAINNAGYRVLHVLEEDFKNNKDFEINRCLEFLKL